MSADDIYHIKVHFELPTSQATYGLYYEETIEASGTDIDTKILGEAFDVHMSSVIRNMLSNDCRQSMISCSKVAGPIAAPRFDTNRTLDVGVETGPSLPNNMSLVCSFGQSVFSARSNGRIRIPGVPEPGTNGVTINAAYQNGSITAFINQLIIPVPELSAGPGRWTLGIISAKIRDAALPAKDWEAAYAAVTSISMNTIVGTLRSRATRAEGVGGVVP